MATKDTLKIILVANSSLVAESTDPVLWQAVFSAIHDCQLLGPSAGGEGANAFLPQEVSGEDHAE